MNQRERLLLSALRGIEDAEAGVRRSKWLLASWVTPLTLLMVGLLLFAVEAVDPNQPAGAVYLV